MLAMPCLSRIICHLTRRSPCCDPCLPRLRLPRYLSLSAVQLYHTFKADLKPLRPFGKFLVVKSGAWNGVRQA